MDNKTRKVLGNISAKAPVRRLTKTVVDTSLEDAAKDALKDPKLKIKNKGRVQQMIDEGKFRTTEEVTDEESIAEIDRYNTKAVQDAIKRGDIPDPKDDPFFRERLWRHEHRDPNAVSSYQSLMAGIKGSRKITPTLDRVVVQFIEKKAESKAGLIIPDSAKEKRSVVEAVVFRIGSECKTSLKEGQRVYVNAYDFDPVEHAGTLFMVGSEKGILVVQDL